MPQAITRLNPPTLPDAGNVGYSQISIVEPGRMAYVSGQVALPPDGSPVPPDLLGQTRVVVRNLQAALDALGADVRDIAIMRIFVVDLTPEALAESFPVVLEMLAGAQPSITGVGVAALADPAFRIEVELTVRVPD
ncbi:MAG: RidA family protein [Gammaproteobacteria bacterium]